MICFHKYLLVDEYLEDVNITENGKRRFNTSSLTRLYKCARCGKYKGTLDTVLGRYKANEINLYKMKKKYEGKK